MKRTLAFLVAGLFAVSSQAHIGWSKAQCEAFYTNAADKQETGPSRGPSPYGDNFFCKVGDVFISIEFIDNNVSSISYSRPGRPFLPAEVYALLGPVRK